MTGVADRTERGSEAGRRIARARREASLSQRELAQLLGTSLWEVERLEKGQVDARGQLPGIAAAIGVTEEHLIDTAATVAEPASRQQEPGGAPSPGARELTRGARLVLGALAVVVVVRFFTEVFPVLPRALNFVDVPILAALGIASLRWPSGPNDNRDWAQFAGVAILFIALTTASAVANPSRVDAGPALVFLYGFAAPLGVYIAAYRLWPPGRAVHLSRLLVGLGLLQLLVVVIIDLPRFLGTNNPDEISGTFGENQYQLVYFLLILAALLVGIFTFEQRRAVARFVPPLLLLVLGTIFLAQYRALLFTVLLTLAGLGLVVGTARVRGILVGGALALAVVVTLTYTSQAFPVLRFAPILQNLRQDPTEYASQRVQTIRAVADLYDDQPRYVLTGTGPGTFSSRGWQTFALLKSTSQSNVQGKYASLLTGGRAYRTDVSDKYVLPRLRTGAIVEGSRAVSSPYTTWSALLAEVGLLGLALIAGVYIVAFLRAGRMTLAVRRNVIPDDPLPAIVVAAAVAFFVLLQMAFLENWLEVTRVTFPAWILLAVATKEMSARKHQANISPSPALGRTTS